MVWKHFQTGFAATIGLAAVTASLGCHEDRANAPSGQGTDVSADRNGNDRTPGMARLHHLVVIYLENRSFDNLYGEFAGANGLTNAGATSTQVDGTGTPFVTLPMVAGSPFPTTLANTPFAIEPFVAATQKVPDLVHRYCQEQQQIDGGKMDKFALVSDAKGESMGYYHTASVPLAAEAAKYTLCDNFFHAAFGGSFLNHFWLVAARTPVFPNAPAAIVAKLDASGNLVTDGAVTPDGYAINTLFTVNTPHASTTAADRLVPNQTFLTIGDRLSARASAGRGTRAGGMPRSPAIRIRCFSSITRCSRSLPTMRMARRRKPSTCVTRPSSWQRRNRESCRPCRSSNRSARTTNIRGTRISSPASTTRSI